MNSTSRATLLIAIFFILSKIFGLARIMVIGFRFGAGRETDIFVAALRVPDLVFNLLILGTLSVAFIPIFIQYLRKDKAEAQTIASTVFNLTLLVMGGVSLLGIALAGPLAGLVAPGFDEEARSQTASMMRILMLSPLFFSLSSVLTSVLHSHKRFLLAAAAPVFYNISLILGVLFLSPRIGLSGLAWGAIFGAFLHFAIQAPSVLRMGLRPFRSFDLKHPGVRRIGRLFLPRILGIDLGQINLLIASIIGSMLGSGSVAIIYFAFDLNTVPLGVFAISFAIASFPVMSEFVSRGRLDVLRDFLSKTAIQILFFIIPISVLMLLLRAQIVRLIPGAFQGTEFDFTATRLTAQALGFFVISLFAQALIPLLARAFYALENTIIPVLTGLAAIAINVALALILTRYAGPEFLALAFSVASLVNMAALAVILHKKIGGFNEDLILLRVLKISVASVVMGTAVFIVMYMVAPLVNMQTYLGVLIQTLSALAAGAVVYVLSGLAIRIPETLDIVNVVKIWFGKLTRPAASAIVNMFTDIS